MPAGDDVHSHYQQGVLTLTCGEAAFARLVAAVAAEGGQAAAPGSPVDMVVIKRPDPPGRPRPVLDSFACAGCAAGAATVIFLLGAGAYTVSRWVWQP